MLLLLLLEVGVSLGEAGVTTAVDAVSVEDVLVEVAAVAAEAVVGVALLEPFDSVGERSEVMVSGSADDASCCWSCCCCCW
jgi:hypothetical protein